MVWKASAHLLGNTHNEGHAWLRGLRKRTQLAEHFCPGHFTGVIVRLSSLLEQIIEELRPGEDVSGQRTLPLLAGCTSSPKSRGSSLSGQDDILARLTGQQSHLLHIDGSSQDAMRRFIDLTRRIEPSIWGAKRVKVLQAGREQERRSLHHRKHRTTKEGKAYGASRQVEGLVTNPYRPRPEMNLCGRCLV